MLLGLVFHWRSQPQPSGRPSRLHTARPPSPPCSCTPLSPNRPTTQVGGAVADLTRRDSLRALNRVNVVLLVLDAERALRTQRVITHRELGLAAAALYEGKALIIVANKARALCRAVPHCVKQVKHYAVSPVVFAAKWSASGGRPLLNAV